jgi:hypothetical protein
MTQQTAVEWFAKQAEIILIDLAKNNNTFQLELCLHGLNDLEEQAKQMEEDINRKSFEAGNKRGWSGYPDTDNWTQPTFEEYYTQTYKNLY